MYKIKVQQLTPEKFRKYGVYQSLTDNDALAKASIVPHSFFADLITLDFGTSTLPTVSVCHVQKQENKIVTFLEAHKYTCEGLLPLDADVIIFVGSPLGPRFSVENLEAFYIPKGTFVKLNPLIVHGTQYLVEAEEGHVLCMLPGRTFNNDMIAQPLEDSEYAEICME